MLISIQGALFHLCLLSDDYFLGRFDSLIVCHRGAIYGVWDDLTLLVGMVLVSVWCSQVMLFNIHHFTEHYIIIILSVSARTHALFRHAEC